MPVHAKGRFPKPSTTFRDDGAAKSTIEEYRALKDMPQADEALKMLRSVGSIVKPIMIKHHWRLPLLVEIYPKQQSLLGFNVNRGQKIALRLRHASSHDDFLDQESIIETMLHELAHNLRGPHDDEFFRHLDILTQEWYELQRNSSHSLPGLGFLTEGTRLGGGGSQVTPAMARRKAAEMAERRRRLAELMEDGGSHRLGGAPPSSSLVAARAEAAERRRNITQNCPSSSAQDTQIAAQEQQEEELLHGIQVITIDDDDGDGDSREELQNQIIPTTSTKEEEVSSDEDDLIIVDVKKAPAKQQLPPKRIDTIPPNLVTQTRAAAALRHNLLAKAGDIQAFQHEMEQASTSSDITIRSRNWNCQQCTLLNSSMSLTCQACDEIRPGLEHWICSNCQHRMLGDFAQYWCCSKCSHIKTA